MAFKAKEFGTHLRLWRQSQDITLRQLAADTGINHSAIHAIETGRYSGIEEISLLMGKILRPSEVSDFFHFEANSPQQEFVHGSLFAKNELVADDFTPQINTHPPAASGWCLIVVFGVVSTIICIAHYLAGQ